MNKSKNETMKLYTLTRYKMWHTEMIKRDSTPAVYFSLEDAQETLEMHYRSLMNDYTLNKVYKNMDNTSVFFQDKMDKYEIRIEETLPVSFGSIFLGLFKCFTTSKKTETK